MVRLRSRCCALSQALLGRSINSSDASTLPVKSMLRLLKKEFDLLQTTRGSCKVGSNGLLLIHTRGNVWLRGRIS